MSDQDEVAALKARLAALEAGSRPPPPPAKAKWGCWIGLALFLVIMAAIGTAFNDGAATPDTAPCDDEIMAYTMMQGFVERRLRAPATAKFPGYFRDGVAVQKTGTCTFAVSGYVDAQNAFGANIRSRFVGEIEAPETGDSYRLKSLTIE